MKDSQIIYIHAVMQDTYTASTYLQVKVPEFLAVGQTIGPLGALTQNKCLEAFC